MSTTNFFGARLDDTTDLRHRPAVLASRLSWAQIEGSLAQVFAPANRARRMGEGFDLFGPLGPWQAQA